MSRSRKVIFNTHMAVGLCAALFLGVMGITGAFLAYEYELDRALNPKLFIVTPKLQRLPLTELMEMVQRAHPAATLTVLDLAALAQNRADVSYQIDIVDRGKIEPTHVFVDPYTGQILGERDGLGFPGTVHEFHSNLMLGKTGKLITTTLSIGMALLALSGLVLWWPRKLVRLDFRSSAGRFNFDLHNTVGSCISLFILLFGLTGIGIHVADDLAPAVDRMTGASSQHEPKVFSRPALPGATAISPDAAVAIAAKAVPGGHVVWIKLPQGAADGYRVRLKFPEDRQTLGRSYAHVDQYSGEVLWSQSTRETAAGTHYFKFWNREVHNGTAFGPWFQALAALTGLAVPLLAITGPIIWYRKNRNWLFAKRRQQVEKPEYASRAV